MAGVIENTGVLGFIRPAIGDIPHLGKEDTQRVHVLAVKTRVLRAHGAALEGAVLEEIGSPVETFRTWLEFRGARIHHLQVAVGVGVQRCWLGRQFLAHQFAIRGDGPRVPGLPRLPAGQQFHLARIKGVGDHIDLHPVDRFLAGRFATHRAAVGLVQRRCLVTGPAAVGEQKLAVGVRQGRGISGLAQRPAPAVAAHGHILVRAVGRDRPQGTGHITAAAGFAAAALAVGIAARGGTALHVWVFVIDRIHDTHAAHVVGTVVVGHREFAGEDFRHRTDRAQYRTHFAALHAPRQPLAGFHGSGLVTVENNRLVGTVAVHPAQPPLVLARLRLVGVRSPGVEILVFVSVPARVKNIAVAHHGRRQCILLVRADIARITAVYIHRPQLHCPARATVAVLLRHAIGRVKAAPAAKLVLPLVHAEGVFEWIQPGAVADKHDLVVVQPVWLAINRLRGMPRYRPFLAGREIVDPQLGVGEPGYLAQPEPDPFRHDRCKLIAVTHRVHYFCAVGAHARLVSHANLTGRGAVVDDLDLAAEVINHHVRLRQAVIDPPHVRRMLPICSLFYRRSRYRLAGAWLTGIHQLPVLFGRRHPQGLKRLAGSQPDILNGSRAVAVHSDCATLLTAVEDPLHALSATHLQQL